MRGASECRTTCWVAPCATYLQPSVSSCPSDDVHDVVRNSTQPRPCVCLAGTMATPSASELFPLIASFLEGVGAKTAAAAVRADLKKLKEVKARQPQPNTRHCAGAALLRALCAPVCSAQL